MSGESLIDTEAGPGLRASRELARHSIFLCPASQPSVLCVVREIRGLVSALYQLLFILIRPSIRANLPTTEQTKSSRVASESLSKSTARAGPITRLKLRPISRNGAPFSPPIHPCCRSSGQTPHPTRRSASTASSSARRCRELLPPHRS